MFDPLAAALAVDKAMKEGHEETLEGLGKASRRLWGGPGRPKKKKKRSAPGFEQGSAGCGPAVLTARPRRRESTARAGMYIPHDDFQEALGRPWETQKKEKKKGRRRGSNPGPLGCEARVVTARPRRPERIKGKRGGWGAGVCPHRAKKW